MLALGISSAEEKQGADKQIDSASDTKTTILNLDQLLSDQDKYKDHVITLAAYYVPHIEGPGISGEKDGWRKGNLSIGNHGKVKFIPGESTRTRVESRLNLRKDTHLSDDDIKRLALDPLTSSFPAIITGTFRVGNYSVQGLNLENHPFIELTQIEEASDNDSRWKTAQTKGEPAGADQPATKPADKPPVKGQPSTPTPKVVPR